MRMTDSPDDSDLPPSADFIRYVLHDRGPCTRHELMEATNRSEATIDRALTTLAEEGMLERLDTETDQYVRYGPKTPSE